MLRRLLLTSAAAALCRLSNRSSAGWSPPRPAQIPAQIPAQSGRETPTAAECNENEGYPKAAPTKKFRVTCQNWQRFGSCRYGERCAFAAGHVDGAALKARPTGKRRANRGLYVLFFGPLPLSHRFVVFDSARDAVCFALTPRALFRISSKENTSHIYKGRHLTFNGFRCILAPTPSHLKSSAIASPADKVAMHAPPLRHLSRPPSAQRRRRRHRRLPQAACAGTSPSSPLSLALNLTRSTAS